MDQIGWNLLGFAMILAALSVVVMAVALIMSARPATDQVRINELRLVSCVYLLPGILLGLVSAILLTFG